MEIFLFRLLFAKWRRTRGTRKYIGADRLLFPYGVSCPDHIEGSSLEIFSWLWIGCKDIAVCRIDGDENFFLQMGGV